MKKNIGLTVDIEVFNNFSLLVGKGNISSTLNDFMATYSNVNTKDGLSLETLNQELNSKQEENHKVSGEIRDLLTQKGIIEKDLKEKEQTRLVKEAEDEHKKKICCVCGSALIPGQKLRVVPKGLICRGCALGINDEIIARKAGLIK
jgi:RNA polymerase-binding transcription factor DksA